MPVWNRADCIAPSIESVLAQTFTGYELLIIDDGSDDDLEQAIQPFLSDIVLYYKRPRGGVSAARNFGLAQARGFCIAYLDSDNTWHPDFLASMHSALRAASHRQAAYCKYNRFKKAANGTRYLDAVLGEPFDFKKLVTGNYIDLNTFVHTQAALNGRVRFDETLKRLTDWDFMLKITQKHTPLFVKDVLVDYNCGFVKNTITAQEDFFSSLITIRERFRMFDDRRVEIIHDGIAYRFENLPDKKYYNYLITAHQSEWDTKKFRAPGFPYMLQIEPTNHCNLACAVCPAASGRSRLNRERRHMTLKEFKKIVDDMEDYLLLLVLWGWGEPFLNPDLPEMIRYAGEKGIQTVTSTNAHVLHDRHYLDRILTSGLTTLIIAIDSLNADNYVWYRQGGNLGKAITGLNNVLKRRKKLGSPTRINLRMVVMKSNEAELDSMRKFAQKLKVDIFSAKTVNPTIGTFDNDENIVPGYPDYRRYAYTPGTFERIRIGGACPAPWFMLNIHSDGNVVPCCYDYDEEMVIGNVIAAPLTGIWNAEGCCSLRKKLFYDKDTLTKCRECDVNFKLSRRGWFVEVTDCNLSAGKRLSRAIRQAALNRLPSGLAAVCGSAYRGLDAAALVLKKRLSFRSSTRLHSSVYPVRLPLADGCTSGWNACHVFRGATKAVIELSCHVSTLLQNCCPHPAHTHAEEELLLLLSGEVDIIIQGEGKSQKSRRIGLTPQHMLFYSRGFAHTLQTTGTEPAGYLMLKWQRRRARRLPVLSCGPYDFRSRSSDIQVQEGMRRRLVFEGRTAYLKKLHCHVTTLAPLAGYAPHKDPYDVIIVVLEGEIETLERCIGPYSVIFYAAGEPHGLRNPSHSASAHYCVFEMHA